MKGRDLLSFYLFRSPLRLFLAVLAVIFMAEFLVMLILPHLVHDAAGDWHRGIIDAALLLAFASPPLWLLIIEPLRDTAIFERRRAQAILDNAGQGILTIDSRQNVQSMNRSAEALFGLPSTSWIGKPVTLLLPEWTSGNCQHRKIETAIRSPTLGQLPVAISISPLNPAHNDGHILMIRDLTEQRKAEQRRVDAAVMRAEQLAILARIASSVAHEIRNPLTSLKMLIQTNREEALKRGMPAEDLELIEQEIGRMEGSLKEFLNLARPNPPRPERICLNDLIHRTFRLIEARARQQHVALQFTQLSPQATLNADRDHLQQLFLNLAINALDAMPSGGELSVTVSQPGDTSSDYELKFADTGCGIPQELLSQMFEAFVTSKPTGTGLGLVVSRRLVEEQGGTISAANRPEGGAVFTIRLSQNPVKVVGTGSSPNLVSLP